MSIFKKVRPNEVFTPRRAEVNEQMYVSRADLERKLKRALEGTQHVIVFGDSGSGKTWLYRKYFHDNNIKFKLVDLSNAVAKSLDDAFLEASEQAEWRPTTKTEKKAVDVNLIISSPSEALEVSYERNLGDPLFNLLSSLKSEGAHPNFIVFDNFEQISRNETVVKQLASLIIRLDNVNFSKFNVRFLFVGVVADMKELIARYEQMGTINNRLVEVPEVTPLTPDEADTLLDRGFKKLKIEFVDRKEAFDRIKFVTCRNAQQLHEFCYILASNVYDLHDLVDNASVIEAEKEWVEVSLNQQNAQIEARLNKRDTKIQRRNQVLYCIGASDEDIYRAARIEEMIRKIFPKTASASALGVDQILAGLSKGSNPLLIKNPNDSSYRLSHPKLRLALRVRLEKLTPEHSPEFFDLIKLLDELSVATGSVQFDKK